MPEGPPPGAGLEDSESGSDNDILMPEGPPPSNVPSSSRTLDLLQNGTDYESNRPEHRSSAAECSSSAIPASTSAYTTGHAIVHTSTATTWPQRRCLYKPTWRHTSTATTSRLFSSSDSIRCCDSGSPFIHPSPNLPSTPRQSITAWAPFLTSKAPHRCPWRYLCKCSTQWCHHLG